VDISTIQATLDELAQRRDVRAADVRANPDSSPYNEGALAFARDLESWLRGELAMALALADDEHADAVAAAVAPRELGHCEVQDCPAVTYGSHQLQESPWHAGVHCVDCSPDSSCPGAPDRRRRRAHL
jgi:hypothetical protein